MDTGARNRALAKIARKLGRDEAAKRLGITPALLHIYANGEFPVPDEIWELVMDIEHRYDIFLWPDGFWCFRDEYDEGTLRDEDYRILVENSSEWLATSAKPSIPRTG